MDPEHRPLTYRISDATDIDWTGPGWYVLFEGDFYRLWLPVPMALCPGEHRVFIYSFDVRQRSAADAVASTTDRPPARIPATGAEVAAVEAATGKTVIGQYVTNDRGPVGEFQFDEDDVDPLDGDQGEDWRAAANEGVSPDDPRYLDDQYSEADRAKVEAMVADWRAAEREDPID